MNKFLKEVLRCAGYYIVMVIVTTVMLPTKVQAPMNRISAIVLIIALIFNIFRMLLGGDESSALTRLSRHITTFVFVAYLIVFLCTLLFDNFSDILESALHAFQ